MDGIGNDFPVFIFKFIFQFFFFQKGVGFFFFNLFFLVISGYGLYITNLQRGGAVGGETAEGEPA